MTSVADNFVRADGALGANWLTVANRAEFTGWTGTPSGNVLISSNGAGPDATNGADCCALWNGGQTFGNDQWAQATIKTVAAATATLNISAVAANTPTSGNATYTYTVATGSTAAAVTGGSLCVYVTGFANAQNNSATGYASPYYATGVTATTFVVHNPAAINESASASGYCPSDSGVGVGVRLQGTSISNLNGYFFHCGTNSFGADLRKAYYELWKVVNGVGQSLGLATGVTALSKVVPSVGDTIAITAVGSLITVYYKSIILTGGDVPVNGIFQVTDTSVTGGGVPGLWTFAVSGPSEYVAANWTSGSVQFAGNNGTTVNAFNGGDIGTATQLATENFKETSGTWGAYDAVPYADGDLHAANASWVYEGASTFTVSSGVVRAGAGQAVSFAYRSDVSSPTNDQWAEEIFTISGATSNSGPAVRVSAVAQTAYIVQCRSNLIQLSRDVAGTITGLGNAASQVLATGDSIRITVIGTTLNVYKNGVLVIGPVTDANIASGNVGIFCTASATDTGFSKWSGGSATELTAATNFVQDSDQYVGVDPTNGAFPIKPDVARTWSQVFENTVTWPNDQYAQATVSSVSDLTKLRGPVVRGAVGANGYLWVNGSATKVNLYKSVSGTPTLLYQPTYSTQLNDVFRLEIYGPFIQAKVNGTVLCTFVDTALTTGKPGLFWNAPGSGLKDIATITAFSAGSFSQSATVTGQAGAFLVGP